MSETQHTSLRDMNSETFNSLVPGTLLTSLPEELREVLKFILSGMLTIYVSMGGDDRNSCHLEAGKPISTLKKALEIIQEIGCGKVCVIRLGKGVFYFEGLFTLPEGLALLTIRGTEAKDSVPETLLFLTELRANGKVCFEDLSIYKP